MGPDCDLIICLIEGIEFHIIRTIDGNGTFLYCDSLEGMSILDKIFMG